MLLSYISGHFRVVKIYSWTGLPTNVFYSSLSDREKMEPVELQKGLLHSRLPAVRKVLVYEKNRGTLQTGTLLQ